MAGIMQSEKSTKLKDNWCGKLTEEHIGQRVTLSGWIATTRDLGGIIFAEVRDRSGFIQIVADPGENPNIHPIFEQLRDEFVVTISGIVSKRPEETYNPNYSTGTM